MANQYGSLKEIRRDISSFNLRLKQIKKYPTPQQTLKQLKKANTVLWLDWKDLSESCTNPELACLKGTEQVSPDGILIFGITHCAVTFGKNSQGFSKFALKSFLRPPTECPICYEKIMVGRIASCPYCGYVICGSCAINLGLESVNIQTAHGTLKCSKCRRDRVFNVHRALLFLPWHGDQFNEDQLDKIKRIMTVHSPEMMRPLSKEEIDAANELEANAVDAHNRLPDDQRVRHIMEIDLTKCAFCKTSFTSKRSKCGGCNKVAYCDAKCQRKHWKKDHKNVCKFMSTFNTGPQ